MLAAIGFNTGIIQDIGYQLTIAIIAVSLALGPAWIQLLGWLQPPQSPPDNDQQP